MNNDNLFTSLINNDIMKSDQVIRYSGLSQADPEYLSYHVLDVMMISYQIGRYMKTNLDTDVSMEILLQRALVHDADETAIGDIQRLVKYSSKELHDKLDALAEDTMKSISKSIDGTDYTYNLWSKAKSDDIEGWIIRIADILSVSSKTVKEVIYHHNLRFLKVADESSNYIRDIIKKLDEKLTDEEWKNSEVRYLQKILNDDIEVMNNLLKIHDKEIEKFGILDPVTNKLLNDRVIEFGQ